MSINSQIYVLILVDGTNLRTTMDRETFNKYYVDCATLDGITYIDDEEVIQFSMSMMDYQFAVKKHYEKMEDA